jgi:hypothetical protein
MLLAILMAAVAGRTPAALEIIDRVLAVAAGQLIMLSDVAAARELGLVSGGSAPDPTREILSQLIDRALVLAEVDRYAPPEPDAAEVDRALAAVRARFATADEFERVLARVGIDERHLRETLRQDLRIRAYMDRRFTVTPPTEEELARYYRDRADRFTRGGRLIPFEEARAQVAVEIAAEQRSGLVADWLAGLRRRGEVVNLYLTP